ncbi:outer membrane protein assembly factor BamB [Streptomyces sp. Ag109_O5-1]|uniref:outer membrane protein assembly factor BamB family protein n=1 Tax=Streptomyces sp. Ag109_O5-1 TaxID=1938851 RepID=UPI000F50FC7B|nr:PQQ-binding-like beta-propeller repeat protein [Streptomyces sp. Ag109_O5-1]RPE44858.1 outer membrane protein assembly factor BamB [Streptomyces sp. Ag109_O5-1]
MTTESSPGQGAPQEEDGWAFRPRRPAAAPRPYREQQRTEPGTSSDGRSPTEPYGRPSGTRWDATMPLRVPGPRADAHEAMREPGRRTPPHTRRGGESADQESGYPPAATAVLDRAARHRPEPVAAQPQPPADASGKRARKTRRSGRIALALAVLAAGGTAAVVLKQQDDATTASTKLTQVWKTPAPAADDALIGSWFTDKLLVRASSRGGLRAYDLTDGKQVWRATSSATDAKHGTVPCAMSPTLGAQGIGTVAFGTDGSTCTWLAGVKASTGKILWSIPLTNTKHPTSATAGTYLQGNVATVVSENFLGGVDIRTGSRVWGYKARGHYCNAYDWGTDGTVLVDDFCLDEKTRFTLTAYDGKTGHVIWRKAEKAHSDVTHILSGSPLVAAVHTASQDAVRVFDSTGTGRKLAVGDDELTTGNNTNADHSARLYGNVLVTPASTSGGTVIDGFDTTTGAKLWTYRSAALAVPASDADDKVYAVTTSGSPQLITIAPRTGRATPVASLPVGTGKWSFTSGTVYVTSDGGVLELNALGSNGGVRLYR